MILAIIPDTRKICVFYTFFWEKLKKTIKDVFN